MSNARSLANFGGIVSDLTGEVKMWPLTTAPKGYLICDGSAVRRADYSDLYATIGTTFGVGDGASTFNLPNYTDRMPFGRGSNTSLSIGATGGYRDAVVPPHGHTVTDPGHGHFQKVGQGGGGSFTPIWSIGAGGSSLSTSNYRTSLESTGITIGTTGTNRGDGNLPPFMAINFIIKY
jgi:microcystin-dependent protein